MRASFQLLLRSTYVGDIIAGAPTKEEAYRVDDKAKEIFREGGFNLIGECQVLAKAY